MAKRDRVLTNGSGPSKRRREQEPGSSSDVEMGAVGDYVGEERDEDDDDGLEDKSMRLWQTVKDVVKDGRPLSIQFSKQPDRKIWSHYYTVIRKPIALDDVKKKIKSRQYPNLESVRQDLELCFNNAMEYNMPESQIHGDASDLLKLVNKTYRKLTHADHGDKPPSMKRLLNSRIQKLMKKTDDSGRILSSMFLELPSKKLYPDYYKLIKEPRCLDATQKQVKRKEYPSSAEFAADVELVFSNAMQYNLEHSSIWEDALVLRDYFRQLMTDLPAPHALPQYSQPPKIKIKMPAALPKVEEPAPALAPPPTISLRVPAPAKAAASKHPEAKAPEVKVRPPSPKLPSTTTIFPRPATVAIGSRGSHSCPGTCRSRPETSTEIPCPAPATVSTPKLAPVKAQSSLKTVAQPVPKPQPARQVKTRTPQSRTPQPTVPILQLHPTTAPSYTNLATNVSFAKLSPLSYMQSPAVAQPAVPVPSYFPPPTTQPAPTPAPVFAKAPTPPPILPPSHQLRYVALRSEPRGRVLRLDNRDGVTSWAMRLERDEKSLSVREIVFMTEPGDTSEEEEEEEEDESDEDAAKPEQPVKKRGRGRPPKVMKTSVKTALPKKKKLKKRGETQVKVNGTLVNEEEENGGGWSVELVAGRNVLEVGEQGGLMWRVYAERLG
ncbi:hypothetical protein D9757_004691 [Collybiopsis confluens]|uniref:Bromo domain-containing protein n=1 Tax=Collybiopsis confluens TaxID=2823264 RepID=A0A8H5MCE3_9AGAR|nr:hypothetical protein D9757_004691 [Collybiopsis confluens]